MSDASLRAACARGHELPLLRARRQRRTSRVLEHRPAVATRRGRGAGPGPPVITGATRVAGVIGDPVRHSLSPLLHNAAYRALGLDWVYVAFEVPGGGAAAARSGACARPGRALGHDAAQDRGRGRVRRAHPRRGRAAQRQHGDAPRRRARARRLDRRLRLSRVAGRIRDRPGRTARCCSARRCGPRGGAGARRRRRAGDGRRPNRPRPRLPPRSRRVARSAGTTGPRPRRRLTSW